MLSTSTKNAPLTFCLNNQVTRFPVLGVGLPLKINDAVFFVVHPVNGVTAFFTRLLDDGKYRLLSTARTTKIVNRKKLSLNMIDLFQFRGWAYLRSVEGLLKLMADRLIFSNNIGESGYFVGDSTIDFCELNYQHSHYIAEFFNALSSFLLVLFGVMSIRNTRFKICGIFLMMVGFGSVLFHSTLLYRLQLLDELPMLWFGSWNAYEILKMEKKSTSVLLPITAALLGTIVHVYFEFPTLFFILHTVYQIPTFLFPWKYWGNPTCRRYTFEFLAYILIAFACWSIDQIFCDYVQHWHLHSAWHLLSGLSIYRWLLLAEYVSKNGLNNKKNK